jgi:peptidoglycan hydrolase-like protein with peptidoglycan-binding domain
MHRSVPKSIALAALLAGAVVAVGGCSSDGDSGASTETVTATVTESVTAPSTAPSTATSTVGTAATAAAVADLERWQTDLKEVGCYAGAIDGTLGPQTEAAIRAYQSAEKLGVDGRLGPQTEAALQNDVNAGTTVCTAPATGTTTAAVPGATGQASLRSPNYSKTFTLSNCSLNADLSNISLRGTADGMSLALDASGGNGTLSVSGGTEQDGVNLRGTVNRVRITQARAFTVGGTFRGANDAGQAFTVAGTCPE